MLVHLSELSDVLVVVPVGDVNIKKHLTDIQFHFEEGLVVFVHTSRRIWCVCWGLFSEAD